MHGTHVQVFASATLWRRIMSSQLLSLRARSAIHGQATDFRNSGVLPAPVSSSITEARALFFLKTMVALVSVASLTHSEGEMARDCQLCPHLPASFAQRLDLDISRRHRHNYPQGPQQWRHTAHDKHTSDSWTACGGKQRT